MQASISSASRTAASIASSSRSTVSTSTTPPSVSSRFSINQAFKTLTDEDIDFFDRLVASLPSQAADFSQLKAAYTAQLPSELDRRYRSAGTSRGPAQVDWDAHLWTILLSFVKVRGRNWRERWDSVRLAFGLDPNSGDETDLSAVTQSTSRSATGSSTQHGADVNSDHGWDQSFERRSRAERKSADPTPAYTPRQTQERRTVLASRYDLGSPRSSSPPPEPRSPPYSHRLLHDELAQEDEALPAHFPTDDPISAIQLRLRRMMQADQLGDHIGLSNSPHHSLNFGNDGRVCGTQTDAVRLPADAKRRFDELVRSSQSARATLRQSRGAQQERHEQKAVDNLQEMAGLWRARRLLQTCLAWWITLTRKQLEMSQNAADASARVTMQKAWERWRAQDEQDLQGRRAGERTDRVRCTLTAFRTWKRLTNVARERKGELKKGSMRSAYYTTTAAVKMRMTRTAFNLWKHNHMCHLADGFRRHHLQGGAFALWQLRSDHTQELQTREKITKIKQSRLILSQSFERWSDRSEKARAMHQFQQHRDRLLLVESLHIWRERTLLSGLSRAFAERRLKLAALDSWKQVLAQRQQHRKQEALARRWRTRRVKQTAFIAWRLSSQKILSMQDQAVQMHGSIQTDNMQSHFHHWQLLSRAALLQRVRTSSALESTFSHWKHRYTSLVTSLQQRESTIVERRQERIKATCIGRWRQLATRFQQREEEAQAKRSKTICNGYFITWRNKQLQHRLLRQKSEAVSDYFTLRSGMHQWRSRLRTQRADNKEAAHNRRLVEQVFEIWRSKAAKQQRLAALLRTSLAESNEKLARAYLQQWVAKIIEVRNRELEVKEQRQRRLLKAALYAWIEACLRHDDQLALMNSYIDVKEEERKRQTFAHWLTFAREQKDRREKAEALEASRRERMLATSWNNWRDKLKERALAMQEYHMLLRRQQLSQRWVLEAWKARTPLLPAIRMRNASLKHNALQRWQQHLPAAQMSNQATRMIRERLVRQHWHKWKDIVKATRQFRAAARFGAGSISTHRLRSLASAANRSMESSSPSAAHSSSPFRANASASSSPSFAMSVPRPRTSLSLRPSSHVVAEDMTPRPGRSGQREPSFSRRGTSVPRHLEANFAAGSTGSSTFLHDDAMPMLDAESPSKEAGSRRARTAAVVAAATPTSTSVSDQSRFSLALKSSTSSVSAVHAPRNGINSASKSSRRQSNVADNGPTLSSAAQRSKSNQRESSDTDSDFARRIKRSAKYEQAISLARSQRADSLASASNDGFESGNSVQSAPVAAVERSSTTRHSLAVAEDMILQLRAKEGSRHRRPV
ncbi:potential spindle pole body-associated protein [Pseudozyma hubeiensis SY62]|uniref:Potential spindle pole body-associated protein n=1 Tax=Pseudozyma hubeiensis (strain SY62) TaxID=1305764 RepID=R9PER1_PSEHS|nr:potential spindle pole body-associated protein [Pseudozyma hubeiensis SY62]GAC99844.1 potential spindle pole body-associated protein [Pseudozyma hubeiensis SY62]